MTETDNPRIHLGANGGPPFAAPDDLVIDEINDLYDEAKNFADGEPISSPEIAEAITKLYDSLHDAGKRADEMRIAEKKPHDDAVQAVQDKWNPFVQPKHGKVALGKEALGALLTPWRKKLADEAAAKAAAAREEAAKLAAEATAAIRASSGNLAERERAEELLGTAKEAIKFAGRQEKRATTGTGLRTVWVATMTDPEAAMDWAYGKNPVAFAELAQSLADAEVRLGVRAVPGFEIRAEKRAA